jgi:hypothetical protein
VTYILKNTVSRYSFTFSYHVRPLLGTLDEEISHRHELLVDGKVEQRAREAQRTGNPGGVVSTLSNELNVPEITGRVLMWTNTPPFLDGRGRGILMVCIMIMIVFIIIMMV